MKKRKSISLSLSFLMTALLIHPSVILADSSDPPPDQIPSQEQVGSDSNDPQESSHDSSDIVDPDTQELDSNLKDPAINDPEILEPESEIDPDFLIDPEAQPLDPEAPPEESIPPATGTDSVDLSIDALIPEEVLEDPLVAPEIQALETQADEPYLGSIPLSFNNDSKDQLLIIHDLSVKLDSGTTLVSYDSDFLHMGITSRNIAFLIKDTHTGEEFDLIELDHEWTLMSGEALDLEIHIKVSCSSRMYQMKNEIIYDYHYEMDPTLIPNQEEEIPEAPLPLPLDPEAGIEEELPVDPEQPSLMPEIPDETFDEDMMVVPETVHEDKKEMPEVLPDTEIDQNISDKNVIENEQIDDTKAEESSDQNQFEASTTSTDDATASMDEIQEVIDSP